MDKLQTFMQKAKENMNHPSLQVLVMGLAIIGSVALLQYLVTDATTRVRVSSSPQIQQEPAVPVLLKEPSQTPEGSPTAPGGMGVDLAELPPQANTSPDWDSSRKPIRGQVVASYAFGYAEFFDDYRLHGGIDYAAPKGSPVLAVLGGTVDTIEEDELFGNKIVIDHGDGWQSLYAPVAEVDVIPGQWVAGGDRLGILGPPPLVEQNRGTHLHFELHHLGEPVDPALYLK